MGWGGKVVVVVVVLMLVVLVIEQIKIIVTIVETIDQSSPSLLWICEFDQFSLYDIDFYCFDCWIHTQKMFDWTNYYIYLTYSLKTRSPNFKQKLKILRKRDDTSTSHVRPSYWIDLKCVIVFIFFYIFLCMYLCVCVWHRNCQIYFSSVEESVHCMCVSYQWHIYICTLYSIHHFNASKSSRVYVYLPDCIHLRCVCRRFYCICFYIWVWVYIHKCLSTFWSVFANIDDKSQIYFTLLFVLMCVCCAF